MAFLALPFKKRKKYFCGFPIPLGEDAFCFSMPKAAVPDSEAFNPVDSYQNKSVNQGPATI